MTDHDDEVAAKVGFWNGNRIIIAVGAVLIVFCLITNLVNGGYQTKPRPYTGDAAKLKSDVSDMMKISKLQAGQFSRSNPARHRIETAQHRTRRALSRFQAAKTGKQKREAETRLKIELMELRRATFEPK